MGGHGPNIADELKEIDLVVREKTEWGPWHPPSDCSVVQRSRLSHAGFFEPRRTGTMSAFFHWS